MIDLSEYLFLQSLLAATVTNVAVQAWAAWLLSISGSDGIKFTVGAKK